MDEEVSEALHTLLSMALENNKYESQKEQFKVVYDYIINLQKELELYKELGIRQYQRPYAKRYLKEKRKQIPRLLYPDSEEIYMDYYDLKEVNKNLTNSLNQKVEEGINLQLRIDKAIEYINTHIIKDIEYENYMQCEREEKEELLDILEGKE